MYKRQIQRHISYKNLTVDARVIVENKVAPFFPDTVYFLSLIEHCEQKTTYMVLRSQKSQRSPGVNGSHVNLKAFYQQLHNSVAEPKGM